MRVEEKERILSAFSSANNALASIRLCMAGVLIGNITPVWLCRYVTNRCSIYVAFGVNLRTYEEAEKIVRCDYELS